MFTLEMINDGPADRPKPFIAKFKFKRAHTEFMVQPDFDAAGGNYLLTITGLQPQAAQILRDCAHSVNHDADVHTWRGKAQPHVFCEGTEQEIVLRSIDLKKVTDCLTYMAEVFSIDLSPDEKKWDTLYILTRQELEKHYTLPSRNGAAR